MLSRSLALLALLQTKSRWNWGILIVPFSISANREVKVTDCGSGRFMERVSFLEGDPWRAHAPGFGNFRGSGDADFGLAAFDPADGVGPEINDLGELLRSGGPSDRRRVLLTIRKPRARNGALVVSPPLNSRISHSGTPWAMERAM